jgi:hypothetical protein
MTRKEDLLPILLLERVLQMILNKSDKQTGVISALCKELDGIFCSS